MMPAFVVDNGLNVSDAAEALYEWNYPRQLLRIRIAEASGSSVDEEDLFAPEYLIARPLLQAIDPSRESRRS